jgi:hypothetical protein
MAKSKFTAKKEPKPRRKRSSKISGVGGRKGNAWKQYVGGGGGSGGRYVPISTEPIPD